MEFKGKEDSERNRATLHRSSTSTSHACVKSISTLWKGAFQKKTSSQRNLKRESATSNHKEYPFHLKHSSSLTLGGVLMFQSSSITPFPTTARVIKESLVVNCVLPSKHSHICFN